MRRQLIIAGFTVLACGLAVGGLLMAGKLARNYLSNSERQQFPFKLIDCPSPPGMEREAFLGEVRYDSEFPETVPILDESLPERLAAAFARHPWVESVDRVEIGPGRRIGVRLTFRTPVLAVIHGEQQVRAVDHSGRLLPRGADTLSLPHLRASSTPAGLGKPWGDPHVESAAAVAGLLQPNQAKLKLTEFRWQGNDLRLRRPRGAEVIWGPAGNDEDVRKLQRLLASLEQLELPTTVIHLRKE